MRVKRGLRKSTWTYPMGTKKMNQAVIDKKSLCLQQLQNTGIAYLMVDSFEKIYINLKRLSLKYRTLKSYTHSSIL